MPPSVETPTELENGPKGIKLKPAEMIGGRRRAASHPSPHDPTAKAPPHVTSVIVPVDEQPQPEQQLETFDAEPPKVKTKYPPQPKQNNNMHAKLQKKNVANNRIGGGVRHSIQRPQNVGSNGWS